MDRILTASFFFPIDRVKVEGCLIKDMDLEHYYKLRQSLTEHGQLRNILIDAEFNVVEGRKIAGVMRELGFSVIEVKLVTSKDHLLQRLALDSEYSTFDFVRVSIELSKTFDLAQKEKLYDRLPFKNIDIDDYIESLQFSLDKFKVDQTSPQQSLFD